jgi:hypothetical protein
MDHTCNQQRQHGRNGLGKQKIQGLSKLYARRCVLGRTVSAPATRSDLSAISVVVMGYLRTHIY